MSVSSNPTTLTEDYQERTQRTSNDNLARFESADANTLFPLPATPWEIYLKLDDRADCPMVSWIELHFSGPLQTSALQDSLTEAVHRHPLLASRLIHKGDQWHWEYDASFVPSLRDPVAEPMLLPRPSTDDSTSADPSPRPLDISREPGCRYWLDNDCQLSDTRVGGSRLIIQLHHACCDGVGLRRVLIDVLAAYSARTGESVEGEAPVVSNRSKRRDQLDVSRLSERGDYSNVTATPPRVRVSWWQKLKNAYYFHVQTPTAILPATKRTNAVQSTISQTGERKRSAASDEPLRHHIFDEDTSSKILQCCREQELSLNDLALALLFRTCRHSNHKRGIDADGTRLRLLMPVDFRSRSDMKMPATNRLSFSFLGRTHGQCDSWPELLSSVQAETKWIKDTRVPLDFLNGLNAVAKRPAAMERLISRQSNMSTSVLTYTGDIARGMKSFFPEEDGRRRIGDTYLDNILIAPPARRNTNVTLGLCINWGQICISANWNRTALGSADCESFLRDFASAWREWLAKSISAAQSPH